jgi:hypothetical protein
MTLPTLTEISEETDPVRKAILEAMLRIIEERPLQIPVGAISVVALAKEAQIKRHWLTQRHTDLKERFIFIKNNYLEPPNPVDEDERQAALLQQISELEARLAAVIDERNKWKASAQLFIRSMNVQEVDLAAKSQTIERLTRRLEKLESSSPTDEISVRRHRRI